MLVDNGVVMPPTEMAWVPGEIVPEVVSVTGFPLGSHRVLGVVPGLV